MSSKNKGGRPIGSLNKNSNDFRNELLKKYKVTPLDYMMEVLNDPEASLERKSWAAEKAAPYIHAKIVSTEVTGPNGGPVQHKMQVEFV